MDENGVDAHLKLRTNKKQYQTNSGIEYNRQILTHVFISN